MRTLHVCLYSCASSICAVVIIDHDLCATLERCKKLNDIALNLSYMTLFLAAVMLIFGCEGVCKQSSRDIDGLEPLRQVCCVVIDGLCQRQCLEQRDQITIKIDTIGLAGFDQRVQIRTGVGSADGIAK